MLYSKSCATRCSGVPRCSSSSSNRLLCRPQRCKVNIFRTQATNSPGSASGQDTESGQEREVNSIQKSGIVPASAVASASEASAAGAPAADSRVADLRASQETPTERSTAASPSPDAATGQAAGSTASAGGMQESSGAGSATVGGGGGGSGGPSAVTLLSRFNGVGYTFVLAGFLKIVTVGGLSLSAPTDVARTAFGKATPYLMVPVGLGMCWVAKQVVDNGLNESKRFLQYSAAAMVVLYFGLLKLMYKYEPQTDMIRRPRPRMPGQMAELRSQLGDRELLAAGDMDSSRFYQADKPGSRELYDDVAWYEGRYPSQLGPAGQQQTRSTTRRAALAVTDTEEEYSVVNTMDAMSRIGAGAAAEKAPARRSYLSDNCR